MASNWFEQHPRITIVGVLLVGFLMLDVLFANMYKLIAGHPWAQDFVSIERQYRVPSDIYHNDLAEKVMVDNVRWGFLTYKVRTNSLGFRDRTTRDVALVTDKPRIVFMGDSFTEGIGYDYEHTFVGRIDSVLAAQGIEVLNAACIGYSPIVYWRKTKHLIEDVGLRFDEMVVFLDVSDVWDEVNQYYLDDSLKVRGKADSAFWEALNKYERSLSEIIRRNTILSITILSEIRRLWYLIDKEQIYAIDAKKSTWTIRDEDYLAYGKQGLEKMKLYMDKLYDLLTAHRVKLTVVVHPWPDQIYYGDFMSIHVSFWKKWCEERQVKFLDCFPYFMKGFSTEERLQVIDNYYIRYDAHFNERGHHLMADVFLDHYGIN